MNYDMIPAKHHNLVRGALEINLRARVQNRYLDTMQATWVAKTKPSSPPRQDRATDSIISLLASLLTLKTQIANAIRK